MSAAVVLIEQMHPDRESEKRFASLVGIDEQKSSLVSVVASLLAPERLEGWLSKHHSGGLPFLSDTVASAPLIILNGDVGCGKTALANCVASPVARRLGKRVTVFETPSNIRGSGLVGDLSARVVEAFDQAKQRARKSPVVLVLDESDDLATSREQSQAHHEDRAGVNMLLKQIDSVARDKLYMAVLMITNRLSVLDPAIRRRAALTVRFDRPGASHRRMVFEWMLQNTKYKSAEINELVNLSDGFTYSDIVDRLGRLAIRIASERDLSFDSALLISLISQIERSPSLGDD